MSAGVSSAGSGRRSPSPRGRGVEVDLHAPAARERLGRLATRARRRVASGSASATMCASSLVPDLGLIGITGTPATQRPDDGHGRLDPGLGQHRHPARPVKLGGDGASRPRQLRVGQRSVREGQRRAVRRGIGEGREEHGVTVCPTARRDDEPPPGLGSGAERPSGPAFSGGRERSSQWPSRPCRPDHHRRRDCADESPGRAVSRPRDSCGLHCPGDRPASGYPHNFN